MPSLKSKTSNDDGRRQREQRKAPAAGEPGGPCGGYAAAGPSPPTAPRQPVGDRLDYSRFQGIGDECREERLKEGDVTWDELKKEEKQQVWQAEEQYERILDQKRQEEDAWRRQLKEKPNDLSWVQGRHFTSYEAFCVGRVEATFKKAGNEAFQQGEHKEAREQWEAGVTMLLALGSMPPEATALLCALRNNLAALSLKQKEWNKVKDLTDKILHHEPENEKALYRRAQAFFAFSLWEKCEADLALLLRHHSGNKEADKLQQEVHSKLGWDRKKLAGRAVDDIAAGIQELCPDGTVRKLRIEEYGEGDPDEPARWLKEAWLRNGTEKAVVTCQLRVWSHGGDELYNSKEYRPHPETKQARDELKEYMEMVNFLDQEAKKAPRLVGDFYMKVKKRPVRWYVGDPGMYKGFDLAVRTMKPGERALFEIDQPALSESVEEHYKKVGIHSGVAGLPQLLYHIEEERLAILEDEVPESELDLDNKLQRGVRAEITMLGYIPFRDRSAEGDGSKLHAVLHPGVPEAPRVQRGDLVRGAFFINRPFDGSLLVQNGYVEWRLGEDEGKYEKVGDSKEPLRPDGGAYVPKCVGQAILEAAEWEELHQGCLIEVRMRYGPELQEIAPMYARQFDQARKDAHKKGRKGGAMCSIIVQTFPPGYPGTEEELAAAKGTVYDESVPNDMDVD